MSDLDSKAYFSGNTIISSLTSKGLQNKLDNSNNNSQSNNSLSELKDVAVQFETIFLEIFLRQARDSKLTNGLFDTKRDDNFEQMFDQELAKSSSNSVDIGIADAIVRQMIKSRIDR